MIGSAAIAAGQMQGTGFVQGRVVDEADAPVTDVTVTVTHSDGATLSAKSDAKGEWKVIGLGRGQWELTFEKKGYTPAKAKAFFESDQTRVWPFTIKLKAAK
jgi:hypothetical protein